MSSPLTRLIARLLLVPILLFGIGILVKGYSQTGGGFSGGLVAALGVMLQYAVFGRETVEQRLPFTAYSAVGLAGAGLVLMLLVTFLPTLAGIAPLTHFPLAQAEVFHIGAIELHTALAFESGIFLVVFGFVVAVLHVIAGGDAP